MSLGEPQASDSLGHALSLGDTVSWQDNEANVVGITASGGVLIQLEPKPWWSKLSAEAAEARQEPFEVASSTVTITGAP